MVCFCCNKEVELTFEIEGLDFCPTCFEMEFFCCDMCRNLEDATYEAFLAGEEMLCRECFHKHFFMCHGCEKVLPHRHGVSVLRRCDEGIPVEFCRSCFIERKKELLKDSQDGFIACSDV